MTTRNIALGLVLLISILHSDLMANAAFAGVKFKAPQIELKAETTRAFRVEFRDLLSDVGSGDLTWYFISEPPSWITYSVANEVMWGTAQVAQAGQSRFTMAVSDNKDPGVEGEPGGVAEIIVTVNITPVWRESPVQLGKHPEGGKFNFDFRDKITFEGSGTLSFSFEDADGDASWVLPNSTGLISGTPQKKDIGPYEIRVTATTPEGVSASVDAFGEVIEVKCPHWVQNPLPLENAKEDFRYEVDTARFVNNPEGMHLAFSLVNHTENSWVQISKNGLLSGTPGKKDQGEVQLTAKVSSTYLTLLCENETVLKFSILHTNHIPKWSQDPIRYSVYETETLNADLSVFVSDVDEMDVLIYKIISGPDWVKLTDEGLLSASPIKEHIGEHTVVVRVDDQLGGIADTHVVIKVLDLNDPPVWSVNPIVLPGAYAGESYAESVAKYAKDPEGGRLSFQKISGPDWAYVTNSGLIIGEPENKNLGLNALTVRALDPELAFADVQVHITVNASQNHPPRWLNSPIPLGDIPVDSAFSFDLSSLAMDDDEDPLSFSLVSGPSWMQVTEKGLVSGDPKDKDLGSFTAVFAVSDKKVSVNADAFGRVIDNIGAPIWLENPISFTAYVDKYFIKNISDKARDPQGMKLTFSKTSGPKWLTMASDGTLYGTPRIENKGENQFVITVSNGKKKADAVLTITVNSDDIQQDVVQLDAPVPGARAENLWLVDNYYCASSGDNELMDSLEQNVDVYFDALNDANIHHEGIYLSSNYYAYSSPIRDSYGKYFMTWSDNSVANNFRNRMARSRTSNKNNSPIWAMYCFYCDVESRYPEIYNNFFTENVPMDVMIVSNNKDHYRNYSANTSKRNWTAKDFVNLFKDFHREEQQNYRISAIARGCPVNMQKGNSADPENPYEVLVTETNGNCYPESQLDMDRFLSDYASKVIFRAYVSAKKSIPLSKTPANPAEIEFSIGLDVIPGNIGSSSDVWYYDQNRNEIVIRWYLMDWTKLNPGDQIRIKYKVRD